MKARDWAIEVGLYCVTIALALAILVAAYRIRLDSLSTPLGWSGDGIYTQVFIQNYLETGNPLHSDRTGAPFGMDLNDFPVAESVHLAIIRGLSLISTDPCWLTNVFFYLGFPLTAFTSLLTLRALGIARLASIVGSLLYAFLPWHYFRFGHLFLASYYLVPLIILVAVWVCQGRLSRGRWVAAVVIGLLASGGGVYYAFFGCFFLVVAGIACAARERRLTGLAPAAALVALISAGLVAQIAPALHAQVALGKNPDVAVRQPFEADMYGLRIIYLLLPVKNHQVPRMGRLHEIYATMSPIGPGESGGSALGVVGSAGLVGLILFFLFSPRRTPDSLGHTLGLMVLAGLLLATVTGFSYLFAFFITPKIRCYNRISIYLAFFALTAVCLVLNHFIQYAKSRGLFGSACAGVGALVVLACGLFDQAPLPFFRASPPAQCQATPVRQFVREIEAALPPDSMVLQLPIVSFPEAGSVLGTGCYDHFRPAICGRSLRWSHGLVRGRYGDAVLAAIGRAPLEQQVEQAALMGYSGIHLDRAGYTGHGEAACEQLRRLLNVEPIVCDNGRDVFFDLRGWISQSRQRQGTASWEERELIARNQVEVSLWSGSTSLNPADPERRRLFFKGTGSVELYNPLDTPRPVTVRFEVVAPGIPEAELRLGGELITYEQKIGLTYSEMRHQLIVPPGKHSISIDCLRDGKPVQFDVSRFDVINQSLSAGKGVARKGGE
jgi:phosphoglycerol transferase